MISSIVTSLCSSFSVFQPKQASQPAQKILFHANIHLIQILRFIPSRELVKLKNVNRAFLSVSITALEYEARTKIKMTLRELCDLTRSQMQGRIVKDFTQISPYLVNLKELDLSNWDFNDKSYLCLRILSSECLQGITSLNFTGAQNLTLIKLKSLLVRLPSLNNGDLKPVNQLNPQALFPSLTSLDFTGIHPGPNPKQLVKECAFLRNGQGAWGDMNGDMYKGGWKDGSRSGIGTLTCADGTNYIGRWSEDELNGEGVATYSNGNRYEGSWKNGLWNGRGTATYADADCTQLTGQWLDGKFIESDARPSSPSGCSLM